MSHSVVRAGYDTWVASAAPADTHGADQVIRASADTWRALVYLSNPVPRGATVTSASLRLVSYDGAGGVEHTVTATRAGASWKAATVSWNTKPATTGPAATGSGWATQGTVTTIDVTAHVQALAAGAAWFGWVISDSEAGGLQFYGSDSRGDVTKRPQLTVEWSDAPSTPTNLRPNGIVSSALPTLAYDFHDVSGDTSLSATEVMIDTSMNTSGPTYTWSGSTPQVPLAETTYAGVPADTTVYWRVRAQDGAGLWSPWSDWATLALTALGAVTITSPTDGGTLADFTPPIVWSFSATQAAWEVRVSQEGNLRHSSGRRTSGETAYTLPANILKNGNNYQVQVRVWDNVSTRVATPEASTFAAAWATFTVAYSDTVEAVSSLTVDSLSGPFIRLRWTRSAAPDHFVIQRDGEVVLVAAPEDVSDGAGAYVFLDYGSGTRVTRTYDVTATVNNVQSLKATGTGSATAYDGVWLVDADTGGTVVLGGTDAGSWDADEDVSVYRPLGATSAIRVFTGAGGLSGALDGTLVDGWPAGRSSTTQKAELERIKREPSQRLWLVLGSVAYPVVIADVVIRPNLESEREHPLFFVSFRWWLADGGAL